VITIIDSGIANIGSVTSALRRVGASFEVVTDASSVEHARALILPGVGAFSDGMKSLQQHRLVEPIRRVAASGRPVLGICLGMQLLADRSEEFGDTAGLGLVPARVVRLPARPGLRVPNIGWCDVVQKPQARMFAGIVNASAFYFVHSYHMLCEDATASVGTIGLNGETFTIAVQHGNVFGAQFHPEKSQDVGLTFLSNFAALAA
jgi:glutamine amidotransferase